MPPLEGLVLDLGVLFVGKRVDILVVDGLDGLEVGFLVIFFQVGVFGLDGVWGGDALKHHVGRQSGQDGNKRQGTRMRQG